VNLNEKDLNDLFVTGKYKDTPLFREELLMVSGRDLSNYIVFDLETTGLSGYAEIIEIGALKIRESRVVESFNTLVKPVNGIPAEASAINGITNAMVRKSPSIEYILPYFFSFAADDLVVGHNIVRFDLPFIRRFAGDEGALFARNYIDTLVLAREKLPHLGRYSLSTLCDYFGIDPQSQHRALGDCYSTNECFRRLI